MQLGDRRLMRKRRRRRHEQLAVDDLVAIAVVLCSTAGIAGIMGWLPASTGGSGDVPALDSVPAASAARLPVASQVKGEARAKVRCAECGVVVATREIDVRGEGAGHDASGGATAGNQDGPRVTSARRYEITILMADRSSRVISDANPASWRCALALPPPHCDPSGRALAPGQPGWQKLHE